MEIAELTPVRRIMKEFDLDPALALMVLLNALGDDHLGVVAMLDRDPLDDEPVTTLEHVLAVIKDEGDRNGMGEQNGTTLLQPIRLRV